MPAQKSDSASRGSAMPRGEVGEDRDLARRVAGSAARPRLDRLDPLGASGSPVVDEVVERAEHEVEQVDVVADVARQQPAGERERARDAPRRRARLVEHDASRASPAAAPARRISPAVTSAPISTPGIPAPGCVPPPTW